MRNLYKRLNLKRNASEDQVHQAILRCTDRSVKIDAESVLLDSKRKALYDQTHKTLESIARMRLGLGLSHKSNWDAHLQSEFVNGQAIPLRLSPETRTTRAPESQRTSTRSKEGKSKPKEDNPYIIWVIIIVVPFLVWLAINSSSNSDSSSGTSYPSTPSTPRQPAFNQPVYETPQHGAIFRYHSGAAVAPLEIRTSGGENYFVKLVDSRTGMTAVELFVHGGRSIEIMIPIGNYVMKYAVGTTWYGREYFFGPETSYSKASSIFNFTEDARGYSGYTVTLYRVANGNMQTQRLSPEDF